MQKNSIKKSLAAKKPACSNKCQMIAKSLNDNIIYCYELHEEVYLLQFNDETCFSPIDI